MLGILVSGPLTIPAGDAAAAPTIIYLVRHAEKAPPPYPDTPADPPLTAEGSKRARDLAHALADAGITRIFSTDLKRTRDTVRPLAARLGIEIETYDGAALEPLAERLLSGHGRFLVSGHSNTTPALAGLLGGDPGPPIDEATEHDRLYVIVVGRDGQAATTLLRYGTPGQH